MVDREMKVKKRKILETIVYLHDDTEETSWHQISQRGLTDQYPAKHMISFPGSCGLYIDRAVVMMMMMMMMIAARSALRQ
ncbi:uncharacterized [Tachysurus ichikawai]